MNLNLRGLFGRRGAQTEGKGESGGVEAQKQQRIRNKHGHDPDNLGGGGSSILSRGPSISITTTSPTPIKQNNKNSTSNSATTPSAPPPHLSYPYQNMSGPSGTTPSSAPVRGKGPTSSAKQRYGFIPDYYNSLEQVTAALREAGLESSNLIVGIDFTKSNEWTGKVSFDRRSLHAIGDSPNPYEKAISIIGKTLAPFDEDNLIPCFGFGDATTHDEEVFSFHSDHTPCHGFEEVLSCYKNIVPNLRLSGPTSYGPAVEAAIDIVESSGGQYHVLVIIADGQVTRSVNTSDGELSPQEEQTIKSIVNASSYPLSIILVGVGDGPWEDMKKFDDKIPAREFDNFQFVNFTEIMTKNATPEEKETAFALAALMEIPLQYRAAVELNLIGSTPGRAKKIVPRPPPIPYTHRPQPSHEPSIVSSFIPDDSTQACPICLTNAKDMAFGCGHMTCRDCGSRISSCPICRQPIANRLRLFR